MNNYGAVIHPQNCIRKATFGSNEPTIGGFFLGGGEGVGRGGGGREEEGGEIVHWSEGKP